MKTIADEFLVHSSSLPAEQPGEMLSLPREEAGWEWMSFYVHRLAPGQRWETRANGEEVALIILGGRCEADWGKGKKQIGQRANVFDGLPYALYLPAGEGGCLKAETLCEVAECRVPSEARLEPRLVTPQDVAVSLRGGGNASREIVDVMSPKFPADKIIAVEVYTPSGNWSSYPPHKHDVHNPPTEADLDEIYYYRTAHPAGYAYQRLYTADGERDLTLTVGDGDLVLVRDGYHPVVAGHGYDVYYLNFLAGSMHSLAFTLDPHHSWVQSEWKGIDPRLPLVGEVTA